MRIDFLFLCRARTPVVFTLRRSSYFDGTALASLSSSARANLPVVLNHYYKRIPDLNQTTRLLSTLAKLSVNETLSSAITSKSTASMEAEEIDAQGNSISCSKMNITDNCAKTILELTNRYIAKYQRKAVLRVSVESGGCHGFSYSFTFDETAPDADDLVMFAKFDAKLVVDKESAKHLNGATIDRVDSLEGSYFTVVNNPNAIQKCGCGTSFSSKVVT